MKTENATPKSGLAARLRQRGGALLAVLGFALLASAIVLLSLTESRNQLEQVKLDKNRRLAHVASEVGLQAALTRLRLGLSGDCDGSISELIAAPTVEGLASDNQPGNGNGNNQGSSQGLLTGLLSELLTTLFGGNPSQPPSTENPAPTGSFGLFSSPPNDSDRDEDGFVDFAEGDTFAAQRVAFATRPSGSFAARVQAVGANTYRIRCMAVDDGVVRVFEAAAKAQSLSNPGVVSRSGITIDVNVRIDSYDSAVGYNPTLKLLVIAGINIFDLTGPLFETYDRAEGSIYAQDGITTASSQVKVMADVSLGPTGTTSGGGLLGAVNLSAAVLDPPPPSYSPPAINDNADAGFAGFYNSLTGRFSVDAGETANLGSDGAASSYVVGDDFEARANSEVVVRGDVTLFVADGIDLLSNSLLTLAPGSTLTIVSDGPIDFSSAVNYSSHRPADLRILQASSDPINVASNTDIIASIEAPLSDVSVATGVEVFGGITANSLDLAANVRIHWDESLSPSSSVTGRLDLNVVVEIR